MALTIRSIAPADIPQMFRISVRAHQDAYSEFIPVERRDDFDHRYTVNQRNEKIYTEMIIARMQNPRWLFWIAEVDGVVAGYTLAFVKSRKRLLKKGMFVLPEYQGNGVGSQLFRISLTGIESGNIELTVVEKNIRARHIYEKNGFIIIGKDPVLFFGAQRVLMRLTKH